MFGYAAFARLLSITSDVTVYSAGKILQKNFVSSGIFLNSDNVIIRDYFKKKYREGKLAAQHYASELVPSAIAL